VKTISITMDFKTKIPPIKVKIHVSMISCQNFNSIRRLTKQESSFYQRNTNYKKRVAPSAGKVVPNDTKSVTWCNIPVEYY